MNKRNIINVMSIVLLIFFVTACAESSGKNGESAKNDENAGLPESYPDKSISYLIGYGPGGGTDITARETIKILNTKDIISASFDVLNMPGASSSRPYEQLLKDPGNPYQIMGVSDFGLPLQNGTLDAEIQDFKPVARVADDTVVIMVGKDSKFNTFEDIVAQLKKDPGSISMAATGSLDTEEPYAWYKILSETSEEEVKIKDLNVVPLDSGSEVVTSVVGQHTDVALVNPGDAIEYYEAGKVKILATLSEERLDDLPEVPTIKEKGIDFVFHRPRTIWIGGDVSQEVVAYWEGKLKELTETEEWKEFANQRLIQVAYLNSEELLDFLNEQAPPFERYINMVHESK